MKKPFIVLAFIWANCCALFAAPVTARQPNIVIFYLDDMGWAQPGVYGGKLAPTPHMNMAEMTALFDKWTATMCPPRWEDLRWNGEPKGPNGPNSKNTKKLDLE